MGNDLAFMLSSAMRSQAMHICLCSCVGRVWKNNNWRAFSYTAHAESFFLDFAYNTLSQAWRRKTRYDCAGIFEVLGHLRADCEVCVVVFAYSMVQLDGNRLYYGRAAPQHSFELALFCSENDMFTDKEYLENVRDRVRRADVAQGRAG